MTKWVSIGRVAKSRNPWETAKMVAYFEQKRRNCWVCGKPSEDAHHAIVKTDKNNRTVDNLINLQMVCHKCHMEGKADGWENTKRAIRDSIRRYGKDEVERWLCQLADEGKQVQEQFNYVAQCNDKGEEA